MLALPVPEVRRLVRWCICTFPEASTIARAAAIATATLIATAGFHRSTSGPILTEIQRRRLERCGDAPPVGLVARVHVGNRDVPNPIRS